MKIIALIWLAGLVVLALPIVVIIAILSLVGPAAATPVSPAAAAEIPPAALADYEAAATWCPGLSWTVLAGIGEVESDHGQSDLPGVQSGANAFGAEGPMQFLPATFAEYAVSLDGSPPSPYDLADAAVAAARMLCADGAADPADLSTAIWDYNHSTSYVAEVLSWAAIYSGSGGGDGDAGQVAANWALTQIGKPYQWGAAGPDAYDCSGLALRAWEQAGVELPRVAADQYGAGVQVPYGDAQVGDLVFFATDPSEPSTIYHVGIYLGAGMMVDAPHTGADVRVEAVWSTGLVPDVTEP